MPDSPKMVTLYPTGTAYIGGVPAVECDVDPETAAELLAYSPPAFVAAPPRKPAKEPAQPASAGSPSDSTETED